DDDPTREGAVAHRIEARGRDQPRQLLGAGKASHACREIGVGGSTRYKLAEQRHHYVEPEAVEGGEEAARPGDLENREPSTVAEHTAQLAHGALEVLDVADAEADGNGIEARIVERKREDVPARPLQVGRLPASAREDAVGEVE